MENKIVWEHGKKCNIDKVRNVEKKLGIKFPDSYIEIVLENDGAQPYFDSIEVNGIDEGFSILFPVNERQPNNIIEVIDSIKDRLVNDLVPFAEDGGGNIFCFDYRKGYPPSIVFWDHELAFENKEKGIFFVAENFEALLDMLHEYREPEQ